MAKVEIQMEIRFSWWVWLYLDWLMFVSKITGQEPDIEKLKYWMKKGMKTKIVKKPIQQRGK